MKKLMSRIVNVLFLLMLIVLVSCTKKEKNNNNEETVEKEAAEDSTSTIEEKLVIDEQRSFIMDDWHPVKQNSYVQKIKDYLKYMTVHDIDESLFNDLFTVEFNLMDDEGRNFCLYHNIRKVKNFDAQDFDIYKYWSTDAVWAFQEKNGLSILWAQDSGAILIMGTEDSRYGTMRGIRVGSTVKDIMDAYAKDSIVEEYNYEERKFKKTQDHEGPCFVLAKSNECISINQGNMVEEEMMTISFLLTDGVVSKIVINCVD